MVKQAKTQSNYPEIPGLVCLVHAQDQPRSTGASLNFKIEL
jgi:hypothetical protein